MGIVMYLILLWGIYRVTRKAFEFEKTSRMEQVIIPAYSLLMFLITMDWRLTSIGLLVVLAVVAVGIAWFQASGTEIKVTGDLDRYQRPEVLLKKNWRYVVGWVAVFLIGFAVGVFQAGEFSYSELVSELGQEVREDLFSFAKLGSKYDWYVWAVSGISSYAYTWLLKRREPTLEQALAHQKSRKERRKNELK